MLVPRSFKYTSSPKDSSRDAISGRRSVSTSVPSGTAPRAMPASQLRSPQRMNTAPVTIPTSKHFDATSATHGASSTPPPASMPHSKSATVGRGRRKPSAHDPSALPPAVAALLAVTTIPRRRPNRYRITPSSNEKVSIDQLVSQWKSEDSTRPTYSSSPALSLLLEDSDVLDEIDDFKRERDAEPSFLNFRSRSSESMPELEADDRSVLSLGSPSTPGSLRSRKSYTNLKKDKARSLPTIECSAFDHPLVAGPDADDEDDDVLLSMQKIAPRATKPRSSFTSNLTTSLQSLKNAAINSISSLGRNSTSAPSAHHSSAPQLDNMLWSHPYLFPHFSSEIRPTTDTNPTEAQRRYLNPMPLTFEEQEAPFQLALHAPYLAEATQNTSAIQMQTYKSRSRRRPVSRRAGGVDPNSEAGRAQMGAEGMRQREVRENSNFLRVVVLEMNMRREGKLESGRARIWLPPREFSPASPSPMAKPTGGVPHRWVGVSAY